MHATKDTRIAKYSFTSFKASSTKKLTYLSTTLEVYTVGIMNPYPKPEIIRFPRITTIGHKFIDTTNPTFKTGP